MSRIKYIDKQQTVQRGFTKKDGIIYKMSVLEIWHSKGWLDAPNSPYSADDRLRYGLKLAFDGHLIARAGLHSGLAFNSKVDISGGTESSSLLDARIRYNRAIRSVPSEFWPIVRQICLDDREPVAPQEMSERRRTYFYFLCRTDLCRGLDRIIAAYTLKLKMKQKNN